MSIELNDYLEKFKDTSHITKDALEGCFIEATRVMGPNGLKTYLDGAYALHSLGKGEDLVVSFLESIPMIAKEVGENIIGDIIMSVLKMASQTSASILVLMLSHMPTVSERMTDLDLLKAYLKLMERMVALAPRGLRPMLENIEELVSKLTIGGLRRWAMYGAETYRRDFQAQIAYFSLESADSLSVLEGERRGILFVDIQRKLQFYLRAFFNREFFLRPTSGDYETKEGQRPYIEQGVIHIPDAYDDIDNGDNKIAGTECYRAVCAHTASHVIYTKKAFDLENINPLQQVCIGLFEDLRVECLSLEDFPGLRSLFISLHPNEDLSNFHPFIVDLVDFSRCILDKEYAPKQKFNSIFRDKFNQQFPENAQDSDFSLKLGLEYYEAVKKETDVKISASALIGIPIAYRDDNRYLWEYEPSDWMNENGEYVPASQKQVQRRVSIMEMVNELDCELAGDDAQEIWTLDGELYNDEGKTYNELEGKEPISEPYHYNEWDYKMQIYRPNWATLYEKRAKKDNPEIIEDIIKTYRPIATRLKNAIDQLQPQGLTRAKKQKEGGDIDIDACIDAMMDIKMGYTPSENIFISKQKNERDVAVDLLLDVSESTNELVVGSDKSILSLMQEATTLLSWAIDKIGDKFAITGFASDSRHDVQYYKYKDYKDAWNDESKAKLAGIKGGLSTRMGTAIRHAGDNLLKQKATKRLLLVLTDGEPADIDVQDPQHLRLDTKMAIEELKSKGVQSYCISLDPLADQYVSRIFGSNRYLVINNIEKLPEKLPQLFISLTK